MIRLGSKVGSGNILSHFYPSRDILESEIFSKFSHMYFSRLQVCGKNIRLGCRWVQGFQGHYTRCGCDFTQTVKKGNLIESVTCI